MTKKLIQIKTNSVTCWQALIRIIWYIYIYVLSFIQATWECLLLIYFVVDKYVEFMDFGNFLNQPRAARNDGGSSHH